jgi:NADPH-dependent 2,4-dienoyl-CoA reductase/sulfur reductase-like enzyme
VTDKACDALVLGGGAAGLSAAARIAREGFSVALLEREAELGGILNQCIHSGFGLQHFREDLTGPEYAERLIGQTQESGGIEVFLDTAALDVGAAPEPCIYGYSRRHGLLRFRPRATVLAMGCRERNRGNLGIPGTRPAGIFTAGLAQRLINIDGYIPGRRAVIVGSGDIGLIMARRLTWVGVEVLAVIEIQPYPSGLTRNIVQCLNDFGIPLYLSHLVTAIRGQDRVEAVEVTPLVDGVLEQQRSFVLPCDTILLSVGLIPDNELSKKLGVSLSPETGGPLVGADLMSSVEGVFACGNVLHVHDLVDYVSQEAESCGGFVAQYLRGAAGRRQHAVAAAANVRYVVPNRYFPELENRFYLRPLVVRNRAQLSVSLDGEPLKRERLPHVQPSEMVSFTLSPGELPALPEGRPNRLEVSIL